MIMKTQTNSISFRLVGLAMAFAASAFAQETPPATPPAPPEAAPQPPPAPDFGNFSSETLTSKAWDAHNAKNHPLAQIYAKKCIEMYQDKAIEMQKALTAPATEKEEVFKSWALNDVGTSYFILGQSLEASGKAKEAIAPYKVLVEKLAFAQCWDAKGWFWKPADTARERVKALEFEALE